MFYQIKCYCYNKINAKNLAKRNSWNNNARYFFGQLVRVNIKENNLTVRVEINKAKAQLTTAQEAYKDALEKWSIANKNLQEANKNNVSEMQ